MLENVKTEDWFRQPTEGVTHIAWQVGHIAVSQYFLTLQRIRGKQSGDAELIPDNFFPLFGKGSTPKAEPVENPAVEEIRSVFDAVHRQAVQELKDLPEEVLDEKTEKPHPMFSTKLGALQFCSQHEMLHAGQIGLLRRLLGYDKLR